MSRRATLVPRRAVTRNGATNHLGTKLDWQQCKLRRPVAGIQTSAALRGKGNLGFGFPSCSAIQRHGDTKDGGGHRSARPNPPRVLAGPASLTSTSLLAFVFVVFFGGPANYSPLRK